MAKRTRLSRAGSRPALLIAIAALWSFGLSLSNTFVAPYLWDQGAPLSHIGWFKLAQFGLMTVGFPLGGVLVKAKGPAATLAAGFTVTAVAYLSLLVPYGPRSLHILAAGTLLGIGFSFFWLGFYLLALSATGGDTRYGLNSWVAAWESISRLIAPLIAAASVASASGLSGYAVPFLLTGFLYALALYLLHRGSPQTAAATYWPISRRSADLPQWRRFLLALLALGVWEGIYLFVPVLLSYLVTSSAWDLGGFVSLTALAGLAASAWAGHWTSRHGAVPALRLGALLLMASALLLFGPARYGWLLLFGLSSAVAYHLLKISLEGRSLEIIAALEAKYGPDAGWTVAKEIALNLGRVLSLLLFTAAAAAASNPLQTRWLLPFLAPVTLLVWHGAAPQPSARR